MIDDAEKLNLIWIIITGNNSRFVWLKTGCLDSAEGSDIFNMPFVRVKPITKALVVFNLKKKHSHNSYFPF